MTQIRTSQVILYLSIVAAIYFTFLGIISYYPVELSKFSIIVELLMGPLAISLLFGLGFSLYKVFKKESSKNVLTILILNSFAIVSLIVLTVIQMR